MPARPTDASSRDGRLALAGGGLLLALGLFAYRPLLRSALQMPDWAGVEGWFFRPDAPPAGLVLAVAGWLLWRRRERLRALPVASRPAATAAWLTLGGVSFAWAHLVDTPEMLLLSLAANLLAFAAATRGRAGCRAVALPALVLLLGLPLPTPVHNEVVWWLQLGSAAGSSWLVERLGHDVTRGGVILFSGNYVFEVIDACSGFRGMEILTLAALSIREAWIASGPRQWLPVLVAPLLGLLLNVVRIAVIVLSDDPGALAGEANHAPQGIAVLVVGAGMLWALAFALAGGRRGRPATPGPPAAERRTGPLRRRLAAVWLLVLGALSVAVPALADRGAGPRPRLELPSQRAGWEAEELAPDRWFLGPLPSSHAVYRRYVRHPVAGGEPEVVQLLAAYEVTQEPVTSRLFGSRLLRPGSAWTIERRRATELAELGVDGDVAVASRAPDAEEAVVVLWRVRDQGWWREAWRSWLRLEATPFRRAERRAIVRLATPLSSDGPPTYEQALRTLDDFIADFRDALADL